MKKYFKDLFKLESLFTKSTGNTLNKERFKESPSLKLKKKASEVKPRGHVFVEQVLFLTFCAVKFKSLKNDHDLCLISVGSIGT